MNLVSINIFSVYLFLFSSLCILEKSLIKCENKSKNGIVYFQFFCWEHFEKGGYRFYCDSKSSLNSLCYSTLKICISNKHIKEIEQSSCPVYFVNTGEFETLGYCGYKGSDNQKSLQNANSQELEITNQTIFFIKVDADIYQKEKRKVSFFGNFSKTATGHSSKLHYIDINLLTNDLKYRNSNFTLLSIALHCKENQYGKYCSNFCKETPNYNCSNDGNKICKEECINYGSCNADKFNSTHCKCFQGISEVNCEVGNKNSSSMTNRKKLSSYLIFSTKRFLYVMLFVIIFISSIIILVWYTTKKQKLKGFSFKKLFDQPENMNNLEESPRQVPVYEL